VETTSFNPSNSVTVARETHPRDVREAIGSAIGGVLIVAAIVLICWNDRTHGWTGAGLALALGAAALTALDLFMDAVLSWRGYSIDVELELDDTYAEELR
jgi:hypothetical protein